MVNIKCKICSKEFKIKPYFLKQGQGKYCSRKCTHESFKKGRVTVCATCNTNLIRVPSDFLNSKSKLFFCNKSCQTIWRNKEYSGKKHSQWKGGRSVYRKIQMSKHISKQCFLCKISDARVIIVHHLDENRNNNIGSNLIWLCRNCHHLVHYDRLAKNELMAALV